MAKKKSTTREEPTLFDRAFAKARIIKAGEEATHNDRLSEVVTFVERLDTQLRSEGMCLLHTSLDLVNRGSNWGQVFGSDEVRKYARAFTVAPSNVIEVAAEQGDESLEARWVAGTMVPQYAPVVVVYLDFPSQDGAAVFAVRGTTAAERPSPRVRADAIVFGFGMTPEPIEGYTGHAPSMRSHHSLSKIAVSLAAGYAGLKHADREAFAALL